MKKIVFLDRDGTINRDYPDKEWAFIKEPELLSNTIELFFISDMVPFI